MYETVVAADHFRKCAESGLRWGAGARWWRSLWRLLAASRESCGRREHELRGRQIDIGRQLAPLDQEILVLRRRLEARLARHTALAAALDRLEVGVRDRPLHFAVRAGELAVEHIPAILARIDREL